MAARFIHTADLHLGKTYRNSPCEAERYDDFFLSFSAIVADAVAEKVDFLLVAGDLFHTGQILPRTFARTIEALQPLREAGIPCIAVEGNHDWIHRRDSISWMEALSQMGYLKLLRPARTVEGGYRFDDFDEESGSGGRISIAGMNVYGLGYVGAQAGAHVGRICDAVDTSRNILLFHVGIWSYSPVEIGNMQPAEALPLAACFDYVALGHGHRPYTVADDSGRRYAFNPGSPERVNYGEQGYEKGYWLVSAEGGEVTADFRPTSPRPMASLSVNLEGSGCADEALARFREEVRVRPAVFARSPLVEITLTGRVRFHPFELGRERLRGVLEEEWAPLHVEVRNRLSLVAGSGCDAGSRRSLAEIEREVVRELVQGTGQQPEEQVDDMVRLALALRDRILAGDAEGEELLDLLEGF